MYSWGRRRMACVREAPPYKMPTPCLEDHPRTCKWLITMVSFRPLNRVIPLINGLSWLVNRGDPNHLLTIPGMILQVSPEKNHRLFSSSAFWESSKKTPGQSMEQSNPWIHKGPCDVSHLDPYTSRNEITRNINPYGLGLMTFWKG